MEKLNKGTFTEQLAIEWFKKMDRGYEFELDLLLSKLASEE